MQFGALIQIDSNFGFKNSDVTKNPNFSKFKLTDGRHLENSFFSTSHQISRVKFSQAGHPYDVYQQCQSTKRKSSLM